MSLILIERIANLNGPIIPDTLNGVLNGSEIDAHKFIITATREGAQVALTGTVTASFLRADGAEVVLTGEIEDGAATVTLAQSCYAVPGRFDLTIFVTADGVKTGVYACTGGVRNTTSGTIIDPGEIVPSVDDIIAKQAELSQDVADASSAIASAQNAVSYLAPGFSTSKTYEVGEYVTQDGALYVCTTAVETAGAWDAANWQSVTFGGELADLKSAVEIHDAAIKELQDTENVPVTMNRYQQISILTKEVKTGQGGGFYVSAPIQVSSGELYIITCEGYGYAAAYAFGNDGALSYVFPEAVITVSTVNLVENKLILIPDGVTELYISNTTQGTVIQPTVYKVVKRDATSKKWEGKKWCVVGDSLTEHNSRTDKNYHDYVAERTGITVVNMGVSGTGYKRKEDTSKAFYQRILNVPTDCDAVTIFGSGNDQPYFSAELLGTATDTGTDTIGGCVNTTIDNLYSVIPAVHLAIVAPCPWKNYNPVNHENGMARYTQLLKEICENRSIPFLDLYHCSNLRPWDASFRELAYSRDTDDGGATYNGVHPNEIGHKLIAGRFESLIASIL